MANTLELFRDGDVSFMVSLDECCPNSLWLTTDVEPRVGRGLGDGASLGVAVGVALDCAQYLPPVFKLLPESSCPPQTIISLSVHTAVVNNRPVGAPMVLVELVDR